MTYSEERASTLANSILTSCSMEHDIALILAHDDEIRRESAEMAVAVLWAQIPTADGKKIKLPDRTVEAMKPYMREAIIGRSEG